MEPVTYTRLPWDVPAKSAIDIGLDTIRRTLQCNQWIRICIAIQMEMSGVHIATVAVMPLFLLFRNAVNVPIPFVWNMDETGHSY
jgi:hypothetical protein